MKILHICNGFCGSKVHKNLTKEMDNLGVEQTVYCPIREKNLFGNNQFESKHTRFVYSFCIRPWYKFFYHYKAYKLYNDLNKKVVLGDFDFIHAHTLFSDGILAYKAHKEYGVKYTVTIRNSDLNGFIRLMKHTYYIGRKILLNADKIYFISVGIKKSFENSAFVLPIISDIKSKFIIQPNGIDDYWLQHILHTPRTGHNILYIGDFSANKNVVRLGKAVIQLKKEVGFDDLHLFIVGGEVKGGGRNNDGKTQRLIDQNPDTLTALGKIYEKDKLAEVMQSCSLFAMPSIYETFGLVYLEALSQNLPVIYTKGQGIDGMFDKSVGIGVNPFSVEEIKNAIKEILLNQDDYSNKNVQFGNFQWSKIASTYIDNYYK